eukprot:2207026-Amphidinium_carterae.2
MAIIRTMKRTFLSTQKSTASVAALLKLAKNKRQRMSHKLSVHVLLTAMRHEAKHPPRIGGT